MESCYIKRTMDGAVVHVVDDDPLVLRGLGTLLRTETHCKVATFASAQAALRAADQRGPDLLVCDLRLGDLDGLALLGHLRERDPDLAGLVLLSVGDVDGRARAVREVGPLGCIDKPWERRELLMKLQAAIERRELARRLRAAEAEL